MGRYYQANDIKNMFSDEALTNALQDLTQDKGRIRKTVVAHGIPYSTVSDHHNGVCKKRYAGQPSVLTYQEEREIVQSCIVLQEMGLPLDRSSLAIESCMSD